MKIKLEHVKYMPKELKPEVLYVSREYSTAAHLCACGCGSKIRTPLTPTEWSLEDSISGPSLKPSIGNWQLPCRSHYWIRNGEIDWSDTWDQEQVTNALNQQQSRRESFYSQQENENSFMQRFWNWLLSIFK